MNVRSAMHFALGLVALAALALGGVPPAVAADTPDPVADAKAFRKFFTEKFPKVKLEDFVNGPYSMNEDMHRQWEEKEQFPPYEFSLDMGKEMFSKPFKNGKSYADCFPNQGIGIRQQFVPGPCHPAPHGGREVEPVAVFQRMDQRPRDVVVANRGACPVIGRRIGDRLHRKDARAGVIGKRNAEALAIGRRDQRKLRPARRAEAVAANRLAAGRAEGRQRDIQRPAEERSERRCRAAAARDVYALGNRFLHWP